MNMIEVKTAELSGKALDLAVAEVVGWQPRTYRDGMVICSAMPGDECVAAPSSDWSQGGPLMEKYHVQTSYNGQGFRTATGEYWCAYACKPSGQEERPSGGGPTPLIAACRAIVAAKLGDTVQVPAELLP